MSELIITNYYKNFIKTIRHKIESGSYKKIVWFGYSNVLSLVYDYLAADGYMISAVLDNDKNKWNTGINRNWCMPFTFHYVDIPKEAVDKIVAGKSFPELKIISPEEFFNREKELAHTLFLTSSYRKEEIERQLLSSGVEAKNILCLPTEMEMWNTACKEIFSKCEEHRKLSDAEHKRMIKNILDDFARFCHRNGLKYYLAYGTLIGAVRHQGFIPWDDDIDILMPVEDYKFFLKNYRSDSPYHALSVESNDNYFFPFAKVVDDRTYLHHHGFPITWIQGTYIDIFPMSGYEEGESFESQLLKHTLLDIEWYWYCIARDVIRKELPDCRNNILNLKFAKGFYDSKNVGVLTTIPAKPWILASYVFGDGTDMMFEGSTYKGPREYDLYLRQIYGDYMKIPPEEEQRIHGFPSYRRTDEQIEN